MYSFFVLFQTNSWTSIVSVNLIFVVALKNYFGYFILEGVIIKHTFVVLNVFYQRGVRFWLTTLEWFLKLFRLVDITEFLKTKITEKKRRKR